MKSRVSVTPHLEPLNRTNAFDFAVAIGATVNIGPDHIYIKEVDEVSFANIPLKLRRTFHGCKFVADLYVLIVNADTLIGCIAYTVRFGEG
jgi:hypothetical protein